MKRLVLIPLLTLIWLIATSALYQAVRPLHAQEAPACQDAYEPDDLDPAWIGDGESQNRTFCPDGDADKARLRVKEGLWYEVRTYGLGALVDTSLAVEVAGVLYKDDDGGQEPLASQVRFQARATCDAVITVVNRQEVFGPDQVYKLYAGQAAAPTPTPTATPKPTKEPAPTDAPAKPVVNFSVEPDHVDKPGDCATLSWSVDRASEVFLVYPNGNQEGVEGEGQRQVCPTQTSSYELKVNAPGGDETARVTVAVAAPTATPTPAATAPSQGSSGQPIPAGKRGTVHVVVFVDQNGSEAYDPPSEGVGGLAVYLVSQADPGKVLVQETDGLGQVHFVATSGAYTVLIPHLAHAEAVAFRGGEMTVDVLVPALRLPSRIP